MPLPVLFGKQHVERLAERFLGRVPEDVFCSPIEQRDAAVFVDRDDAVEGDRDRPGKLRFGFTTCLAGSFWFKERSELRRDHLGYAQWPGGRPSSVLEIATDDGHGLAVDKNRDCDCGVQTCDSRE